VEHWLFGQLLEQRKRYPAMHMNVSITRQSLKLGADKGTHKPLSAVGVVCFLFNGKAYTEESNKYNETPQNSERMTYVHSLIQRTINQLFTLKTRCQASKW
jgi:hypothetical protein